MRRLIVTVVPVLQLLGGCGVELPAPALDGVEPSWGWNQDLTAVEITGRNLLRRVTVDAVRGQATLDGQFVASLVGEDGQEFELTGVTSVDDRTLAAVVGQGLVPGLYDLEVATPSGDLATLQAAFTVTDVQASRLDVRATRTVNEVGQAGPFEVVLLDPNGLPILQSFPVVITATDETGLPVGDFSPSATFGTTSESIGVLEGTLGEEGYSLLALTVERPADVSVVVQPADPLSTVSGGSATIAWRSGSNQSLRVALPNDGGDFTATAGVPFTVDLQVEDSLGNPFPGSFTVTIKNRCTGFAQTLDVEGLTPLEVTLLGATESRCAGRPDFLYADFGPDGQSEPFEVLAGPLEALEIKLEENEYVRAGDPLDMFVVGLDASGNPVDWLDEAQFQDSVGGLLEQPDCSKLIEDRRSCTATPTIAADEVTLSVTQPRDGTTPLVGTSEPFMVRSSLTVAELELQVEGPITAGVPHAFRVVALDEFGNAHSPTDPELDAERFSFSGPEGPLGCSFGGDDGSGDLLFECSAYVADKRSVFTVMVDEVVGTSTPADVNNGPLNVVDAVILDPEPVAGELVSVSLAGFDAWGNPYVDQDDPEVRIEDSYDSFSGDFSLDGTGQAVAVVQFTVAGPTSVEVSRGGERLGVSAEVDVLAGPSAELAVSVLTPWAWVGDEVDVRIESLDEFGNRTSYDGVSEGGLESLTGAAAGVPFTMVNGVGTAELMWDRAVLDEAVLARLDALEGESATFPVVRLCPDRGIILDASFSGFEDAIVCSRVDGGADLAVSFEDSEPGDLALYAASVLDEASSTDVPSLVLPLPGEGAWDVDLLVVDRTGCAAAATRRAWVGAPTGEPVGEIRLVSDTPLIRVRSGPGEGAELTVGPVVDCSRDAASGAAIRLRTSKGELVGAGPSGEGLEIALDATGRGSVILETATVSRGGESTVTAWVPSLTASGQTTIAVEGDEALPVVWDQDPAGDIDALLSTVTVTFSEPMLEVSVEPRAFTVLGPSPVEVIDVQIRDDGQVAELSFSETIEASEGVWTLQIDEEIVRDTSGNKLDGSWLGVASPYVGTFGDVGGALDEVTCEVVSPASGRFRPDGDDGVAEESDFVNLGLSSASEPAWWIVTVLTPRGDVVDLQWVEPAGAEDSWSWSGRDSSGEVVENGTYEIAVQAQDGDGNRTVGCVVTPIVVDNQGGM